MPGTNIDLFYSEYTQKVLDEGLIDNLDEFVYGCGPENPMAVLIGEAPGKDEVREKTPFVGSAGMKLNAKLAIAGLDRQHLFITNAMKYRLGKIGKSGRTVNRPATLSDIRFSMIWIKRELEILSPKIVITLGNVPLKSVTGDIKANIGEMHGEPYKDILDGDKMLFPMYHPASLIYNRSLNEVYERDFEKLLEICNEMKINFVK